MFEELAIALNLDLVLVAIGIATTVGLTNALKKFGKLKGYANLLPVGGCALGLGSLFGIPDPVSMVAYVLIIGIGAVIGWETVKASMHKMGK